MENNVIYPKDVVMTLNGNEKATLEGVTGIISYSDDEIKLSSKNHILQFVGLNLTIKTISYKYAIIEGKINHINFL